MSSYIRTHLKQLESEAIYVIREVAAQFERPVLLFSGGKDSIVLSHLAYRAFYPGRIPFPLLHIDTGHNFQEALDFRDELARKLHVQLLVRYVQDSIDQGRAIEETGPNASRNGLQTVTLLDAKERFFSHRDAFGQWDPKNQRPELWSLYNGRKNPNEHFRVFPISNWTEMDIWQYVKLHNIALPSLYFAHHRELVWREGMWLAISDVIKPQQQETVVRKLVRFRTVGDMTCTGAVESGASTLDEIIQEVASARVTERGGRADDKRSEAAMEDRKRQGYF
jgi:sulfate adenylyltransferase subunit 2